MGPLSSKISYLAIHPGYACNFRCAHCGVTEDRKLRLSEKEIFMLGETINNYRFALLSFVGGEPTLYVTEINRVLSCVKDLLGTEISITTNGAFGKDAGAVDTVLSSFRKLNKVQLSYDRYHEKFLPFHNVRHVYEGCQRLGIKFSVVLTIQSPMDLALVTKLRVHGDFPIGIQKVLPFGNAKRNGIDYSHTSFDKKILNNFCPNRGKVSYSCGRGFSLCDVLNSSPVSVNGREGWFYPTMAGLLKSEAFRMISTYNFRGILKASKISTSTLLSKHSSPCVLCETAFCQSGR